jgi:hypothetical protein
MQKVGAAFSDTLGHKTSKRNAWENSCYREV